jgi:hypothetical protein
MLFKFWESFFKSDFFIHGGGSSSSYEIQKSLRFRASASAYLSRTTTATGNQDLWTWSAWLKRGTLSGAASYTLFASPIVPATSEESISFTNDALRWGDGATGENYATTGVWRDSSAWYHVVFAYDSNNATAGDRMKIYVNGERKTTSGSNMALNRNSNFTTTGKALALGRFSSLASAYFDGHMSEINFIDGQALTPSDFGQTDSTTGQWVPKAYTGTYGTNGFYLGFDDGTNTTTLGNDQSGNNNDWTLNNISLTAGITYDWMEDTPTNNYATLNALSQSGTLSTLSSANLGINCGSGSLSGRLSTIAINNKVYAEVLLSAVGNGTGVGVGFPRNGVVSYADSIVYLFNGTKSIYSTNTAYGAAYTTNTIGIAVDKNAGTVEFFRDNVSQGVITDSRITTDEQFFAHINQTSGGVSTANWNFGQRPFTYTPPTGFVASCTQNLTTPAIKRGDDYFNAKTRTGTGAVGSVTGQRFSPDLVWVKARSATLGSRIYDTVRGATKFISSNAVSAEGTSSNGLTAFNSDGFSFGADTDTGTNQNGTTYIDWMWDESVTAGFDIVSYTGNGANRTIAHGLGVVPKLIIIKKLSAISSAGWMVYHVNQNASPQNGNVYLSATAAYTADATVWNSTAPTSSVFSVGTHIDVNANTATFVAYLFAEVEGFSKFGSFVGNASADGQFVYTGHSARWVMIKCISTTSDWYIFDTARSSSNVVAAELNANLADAEVTVTSLDIVSNGFKMRLAGVPNSAQTFIYASFAECPFKYSNAR